MQRGVVLNLEIRIRRLSGSRLIQDYVQGSPEALSFFHGSPRDLGSYRSKAAEVDTRFDRGRRERVAELIRAPSPGAAARLEEVVAGNGLIVTTGQQPGLFTGPLYTIHKALSAVRLAAALERALDRPVLPVFWIASDDHDWEEANHTWLLDGRNELHRIELAASSDAPPVAMRNRRLGPEIDAALDEFVKCLPSTEFAGPLLDGLRAAYRPDRTVAEAFTDLLMELLAPFDLAFVDGGQPGVKLAASELLRRELEEAAECEDRLRRQSRALEDAGYAIQVPVLEGATNVLFEDEHGRERIFRDGNDFVLRRTGRRLPRRELLSRLAAEPERFSANVALRPVVESAVFPTIAYVGGPGEVSYFAQLGQLFEAHGIGMPVVFPRFSVTLVETKVAKVCRKFGLDIDDFRIPSHELASRVVRQEMPEEVTAALRSLRRTLSEGYERLVAATRSIDPTLKGPIEKARNAGHMQLGEVEKKIAQHLKAQSELGLDQIAKAQANLFPNGQPQERVLNVYQYLVRFGPEFFTAIAEAMAVELGVSAAAV